MVTLQGAENVIDGKAEPGLCNKSLSDQSPLNNLEEYPFQDQSPTCTFRRRAKHRAQRAFSAGRESSADGVMPGD